MHALFVRSKLKAWSRIGTRVGVCLLIAMGTLEAQVASAAYSDLWGANGEKWSPQSRLPDFSFAGYRMGANLPSLGVVQNVKNHGAKGDGSTDDSGAFLNAINAASNGAVYIPEGVYVLRKQIVIKKGNVVLRGAGRGRTILRFPDHLTTAAGPDVGNTTGGIVTSNYSWSHGFIEFIGEDRSRDSLLANVTGEVARGSRSFTVSSTGKLYVGLMIMLTLTDNGDNSLGNHMNAEQWQAGSLQSGKEAVQFVSKITGISGNQVTLERPLRTDIRSKWSPRLYAMNYSVKNVGVESLTMEFPNVKYPGHHKEQAYNGMQFTQVMDCWMKNIGFKNADSGFFLMGSRSCTFDDIEWDASAGRFTGSGNQAGTGHHGVYFDEASHDNLMQNFNYKVQFVHEITVGKGSSGNVFRGGRGVNIAFDQHSLAPYENLYTNIDAGQGSRSIWFSGGGPAAEWGPHTAARTTFWNIRSVGAQRFPNRLWPDWSPDQLNVVGINAADPTEKNATRRWFEAIPPSELVPQDLYAAQRSRRLANPPPANEPPVSGGSGPGSGYKSLVFAHSGSCLDINAKSTANGAIVQQWTCTGGTNQKFEFLAKGGGQYQLRVQNSAKCLDVKDKSTSDGASIQQWECTTGANQLWTVVSMGADRFSLKSVHSGKCIEVGAASTANGKVATQWTCNGKAHQQFSHK